MLAGGTYLVQRRALTGQNGPLLGYSSGNRKYSRSAGPPKLETMIAPNRRKFPAWKHKGMPNSRIQAYFCGRSTILVSSGRQLNRSGNSAEMPRLTCMSVGQR